ncbi:histidine phosphatase family protein [Bradyrhizobium sp. BWA-3-5]|uniref:histidine phosphatase family protein n=1 Tax=Bradyrhizobium sp. BWA-3-5 TaxID=3080013 RepID=UPI00293E2142|nr:histidine phosphatase family protein [Bradyrhizobium sp. BWA-3-5]WOH69450.1 histidine phosphatase family protein [Bradyrhizobium sp. BWA-3-5]
MNKLVPIISFLLTFLLIPPPTYAADLDGLIASLKGGGYVIVFRHGATDDSQKDVYPFKFDDMSAQRQLNDKGRAMARELGAALAKLGVPIGDVYTSRLNRAVETGRLIGGKDVSPVDELTDSGAGSSSGMANPDGKNAKIGRAVRDLVNAPPKAGVNNLAVTHKTNVTDAFGKEFADIREGEALVYKTSASGPAAFVARVQASEWIALAGS